MKLLESIFEPDSESSESKQETESNEPNAVWQKDQMIGMPAHTPAPITSRESPTEESQKDSQSLAERVVKKERKP